MKKTSGFTLIELMIVIAIIGILMASTFKLMGIAQDAEKRAVTSARLEKLQNALSGYHSAYGMYPAVPIYGDPNSASAQPIAFEYPTPVPLDEWIPMHFLPRNVTTVNVVIRSNPGTMEQDMDWENYKAFKFGLMSFLVPRVEVVGAHTNNAPVPEAYQTIQWTSNNLLSKGGASINIDAALEKQRGVENEACASWMPCFENMLSSFKGTILGVKVSGGSGGDNLVVHTMGNVEVALAQITVHDGWGREFYYHSAPPYQSYRIWSAGADGKTYPPWLTAPAGANATAIKDDIIGGKMQ
jgi:prepilin-type N-terminal cleavage/methylation domain-containing protein